MIKALRLCVKFCASNYRLEPNCGGAGLKYLTLYGGNNEKKRIKLFNLKNSYVNRYRRKLPKVNASIFDPALSHTRRSDVSEKREENSVSTFGRFNLWTSFESSPLSVNLKNKWYLGGVSLENVMKLGNIPFCERAFDEIYNECVSSL